MGGFMLHHLLFGLGFFCSLFLHFSLASAIPPDEIIITNEEYFSKSKSFSLPLETYTNTRYKKSNRLSGHFSEDFSSIALNNFIGPDEIQQIILYSSTNIKLMLTPLVAKRINVPYIVVNEYDIIGIPHNLNLTQLYYFVNCSYWQVKHIGTDYKVVARVRGLGGVEGDVSPFNVKYAGKFDKSIYDQNDYFSQHEADLVKPINDSDLANGLMQHLKMKKLARLETVCLEECKRQIGAYATIINKEGGFWDKFGAFISQLPLMPNIGNITNEFRELSKEEAKKKMYDLMLQMEYMKRNIDFESVLDLEKKYIVRKRFIQSAKLTNQIEEALLLAREEGIYLELVRSFLNHALSLPLQHKRIELDPVIKEMRSDPFFSRFESSLKSQLELIVTKISIDSLTPDTMSDSVNRGIYYFYGNPSAGKTCAARKISELLGLPCFETSIKSLQDLSRDALEGAERTMMKDSQGLLADALMALSPNDNMSYKNSILILNDFDRVLFPSQNPIVIPEALTFLLQYLDPETKSYENKYFKAALDISRLTIIITANRPLPDNKDIEIKEDPFAALRSRVTQINFPDFKDQILEEMLQPYLLTLLMKYNINEQQQTEQIKQQLIKYAFDAQKRITKQIELRDLKRQLETGVGFLKLHSKVPRLTPIPPLKSK